MHLAAFDELVPVNALDLVRVVRSSDASRVNDTDRWLRVTTGLYPNLLVKHSHNKLKRSVSLPLAEIVINGVPRRKVIRHHTPLASSLKEIKEGIDNIPKHMFSLARPVREVFLDLRPLIVSKVGWIIHRIMQFDFVCKNTKKYPIQSTGNQLLINIFMLINRVDIHKFRNKI